MYNYMVCRNVFYEKLTTKYIGDNKVELSENDSVFKLLEGSMYYIYSIKIDKEFNITIEYTDESIIKRIVYMERIEKGDYIEIGPIETEKPMCIGDEIDLSTGRVEEIQGFRYRLGKQPNNMAFVYKELVEHPENEIIRKKLKNDIERIKCICMENGMVEDIVDGTIIYIQ